MAAVKTRVRSRPGHFRGIRTVHGECPVWNQSDSRLYWVDIESKALESADAQGRDFRSWQLPRRICSFAFRREAGVLAALDDGLYQLDLRDSSVIRASSFKPRSGIRLNDGKCDRHGRFWFGSMDENESEALGKCFVFGGTRPRAVVSGFTVFNGPSFSPDDRIIYLMDSPKKKIYAYDFDVESGALHHRRIFADTREQPGVPDGSTVDAEGFLWCAFWGGGRVIRFAPDGRVDRVVELPVSQPSSCCFGGDDLRTLFVTSARKGLSDAELKSQPLAGHIFVLEPGVSGLPFAYFAPFR